MTIPGLPAGYSVRRPTLADGEAILAVVHAAERDALGRDDSTLAEVHELLRLPRTPPETDHWLVEANGQAAAWGMVIDDHGGENVDLDVYADPVHPEQVRQALLDIVLERVREHATQRRTGEVIVGAGVIVGDEPYAAALRARGFRHRTALQPAQGRARPGTPFPSAPHGLALDRFDPHPIPTGRTGMTSCRFVRRALGLRADGPVGLPGVGHRRGRPGVRPLALRGGHAPARDLSGQRSSSRRGGWIRYLGILPPRGAVGARYLLEHVLALYAADGRPGQGSRSTPRTSPGTATIRIRWHASVDANRRVPAARPRRWLSRSPRPVGSLLLHPLLTNIPPTIPPSWRSPIVPFAPITEDCIDSDPTPIRLASAVTTCRSAPIRPLPPRHRARRAGRGGRNGRNKISFTVGRNTRC